MTRPDELVVEGWLLDPPGRDPLATDSVPMVVEIHGGPSAMWGPGERTMWHEFQWLAGLGYAVTYANPRGSGGYGTAFKPRTRKTGVRVPAVMCWRFAMRPSKNRGLTAIALPDRCSYGGYLTAWTVTQTTGSKPPSPGGVYDLPVFYAEGRAWRLVKPPTVTRTIRKLLNCCAGQPSVSGRRHQDPIADLHGDRDRTFVQSEMLYRLSSVAGPPPSWCWTEANHNLSRTGPMVDRMDRLIRIADYFDRYDTQSGLTRFFITSI